MYRHIFYPILMLLLLTSTAMAKGEKLVLVGSGAPDPKDNLLIENLEKWGYVVEPHEHGANHPVNLADIDLVFISESTSSANILGAYKDSTVPVVNAESFTYDIWDFRQTAHSTPIQVTK